MKQTKTENREARPDTADRDVTQLKIIWQESFPGKSTWWQPAQTRETVFRRKAKEAGYDAREIAFFLQTKE